ncbi:MAG TPA: ABC transporter permease [Terriglobia bacterium]|nr:ABC transporter permease [Terriglobia bacterium]
MPDWKEEITRQLPGLNLLPAREAEIVEEVEQHLDDRYRELLAGGATEDEARRMALGEISEERLLAKGLERVEHQETREPVVLGAREKGNIPAGLWQDTRHGLRILAKNPGFAVVTAVTLALGIGLNTAIFTMVNALLLRPLPVRHPEQIYTLSASGKGGGNVFSYQDLEDIRKQTTSLFSDLAGVQILGATGLSMAGKSERMWTDFVTGNLFGITGVRPALGRFILPSEGHVAGADPVLVLSYSFWKTHLGADRNIIGKKASVNGRPVTIVGVAPEGFRPVSTLLDTQGYLPLGMAVVDNQTKSDFLNDRQDKRLVLIARLKPGITRVKIRSVLDVVAKRLAAQYPKADDWRALNAFPLPPTGPTSDPQEGLGVVGALFLALAAVVLILACVNVANILLVRASVRRGEIAIRAALGAQRGRIIGQLLTESLLLALLGCVSGLVVGRAGSRVLSSLSFHMDIPVVLDFHFDWRVFGYALALALVAGVIAGIAPAWRATAGDWNEVLHGSGRTTNAGGQGLRKGLVTAQVGGSLMLLIVAGLFVRSLLNIQKSDLGFDPKHVLNITLNPSLAGYSKTQSYEFVDGVLERVRALPGIESASVAASVPMGGNNQGSYIEVEGLASSPKQQAPSSGYNIVSSAYFETMGIRLLHGRGIEETDKQNSVPIAVINQAMAERLWPGKDPLGKRFRLEDDLNHPLEVVGVVKNTRTADLTSPQGSFFYIPFAQKRVLPVTLQLRTCGNPEAMGPGVIGLIRSLAPAMPVAGAETMTDALNTPNGLWSFRLGAGLAAAMGILGLILTIIGVYGVVSYIATQRTHEIGIRLALGAQPGQILRMIFLQGLRIVVPGTVIGVLAAFALARLMAGVLAGVTSTDPLTYAGVSVLLTVVALTASYIPARRATKVHPMVALRHE